MANATNYLKDELRDHVIKRLAYAVPTNIYVALYTDATTDAGGGTEVTGGSYARQLVSAWTDGSNGVCSNTNAVVFSAMPAATVTHFAILDAPSGGNMLLHDELKLERVVVSGQPVQFDAGELVVAVG